MTLIDSDSLSNGCLVGKVSTKLSFLFGKIYLRICEACVILQFNTVD